MQSRLGCDAMTPTLLVGVHPSLLELLYLLISIENNLTSGDGTPDNDVQDITTAQISSSLTSFPTSPAEIRCMIYAGMVNNPRVLRFYRRNRNQGIARSGLLPRRHAVAPTSLFLNKEAHHEIMKHITLVSRARENNAHRVPFSYINPKYDMVYCSTFFDCPKIHQVPGIETLAYVSDTVCNN